MTTATSPDKSRTSLLNFRVASVERQQLQQLAESQGLSLSGLVRQALETQGFQPCR